MSENYPHVNFQAADGRFGLLLVFLTAFSCSHALDLQAAELLVGAASTVSRPTSLWLSRDSSTRG